MKAILQPIDNINILQGSNKNVHIDAFLEYTLKAKICESKII